MKYFLVFLLLVSAPAFSTGTSQPPTPPPTAPQTDDDHPERRFCFRSKVHKVGCAVGVFGLGVYAGYSWDAKPAEQIKFGVQVKPGER